MHELTGLAIAIFLFTSIPAYAQPAGAPTPVPPVDRTGWLPFVVPSIADERTEGSLIDLSELNPAPAGAGGFLQADGERIVDSSGKPVRLFGSNICDFHVMPPKDQAPLMAKRLKQLGMNFVRLHYYDWTFAPDGMMNPDMQSLNPEKLDQMDFLVAQLKENGVYVDLNLHVARGYPGLPEGWNPMGKSIDYLHEPFIRSQEQFARDLLSHFNPYTKSTYAQEPAIAVIELNNENTALTFWGGGIGRYAKLPDEFRLPLQAGFAAYLKEAYTSTDRLKAAWNVDGVSGANLLKNGGFADGLADWAVESAEGAQGTANPMDEDGKHFLRWITTVPGPSDWNLQIMQRGVPVRDGDRYTLTLLARSKTGSDLMASLMLQAEPWTQVGIEQTITLTPDWAEHQISWAVRNTSTVPVRLNLSAGNKVGQFDLANLRLQKGQIKGLADGQTIEDATVDLTAANAAKARDLVGFVHDAELQYFIRMRRLIRDELGARQMILCTQANYGETLGLLRENAFADLTDVHSYPSHPKEPVNGWGWSVKHLSLAEDAFAGRTPLDEAVHRIAGRPILCTEFDLNPPNNFAAETFPYLAVIGSYQNFSGLLDYSWFNFQQGYDHRRISNSFASTGHAGQMAMVPGAMLVYRLGLIEPARSRLTLVLSPDELKAETEPPRVWDILKRLGVPPTVLLQTGFAATFDPNADKSSIRGDVPAGAGTIVSDTGQITLERSVKGSEYLSVNAPAARMAFGKIVGRPLELGDVTFDVEAGFDRYANVSLVAIDGKPIAESSKLLLTTLARVENSDQEWNETGTAVKWGQGETVAEPVRMSLKLPGDGWKAQVLDGNGKPTSGIEISDGRLQTQGKGVWYLITR